MILLLIRILLTIDLVYSKVIEKNHHAEASVAYHYNSQISNLETICIIILVFTILMLLSCINERNNKN